MKWPKVERKIGPDGWTEYYNTHRIKLATGMECVCSWSTDRQKPGYSVSFNGIDLRDNSQDLEEAKKRALRLAKRLLDEANVKLAELMRHE